MSVASDQGSEYLAAQSTVCCVDFPRDLSDICVTTESEEPAMRTITINNRRIPAFRFHSLEPALRTAGRKRGLTVVMGDCPEYWLVSMADAQRLEAAGYEMVTQSSLTR